MRACGVGCVFRPGICCWWRCWASRAAAKACEIWSGLLRHHWVLGQQLGLELRRPPSDSAFRYFFLQVDVAALCAAIRDWTIAPIPGGAADLDQLVCDGKTLQRLDRAHARWRLGIHCPGDALLRRPGCGVLLRRSLTATARPATPPARTMSGRSSNSCSVRWIWTVY